jgi:hypothetical protein
MENKINSHLMDNEMMVLYEDWNKDFLLLLNNFYLDFQLIYLMDQ